MLTILTRHPKGFGIHFGLENLISLPSIRCRGLHRPEIGLPYPRCRNLTGTQPNRRVEFSGAYPYYLDYVVFN